MSVVTGKEVVKQYYGQAQDTSYYMGCSTGSGFHSASIAILTDRGHLERRRTPGVRVQISHADDGSLACIRLKEVQTFPEDFDGVVSNS